MTPWALTSTIPKRAQAFTTGAHTAGYTVSSIGVSFAGISDPSTAGDQLIVTLNANGNGNPGDALCTLGNPASFTGSGVQTFAAPATCPTLTASTTYFAVIERVGSTAGTISLDLAFNLSEDTGAAAGWSIADVRHFSKDGSWGTGTKATISGGPYRIAVRGALVPFPVLIKNTGQFNDGTVRRLTSGNPKRAQAFTTGSNSAGYTLYAIAFDFDDIGAITTAGSHLAVTLNEDSGGDPGTALCTLTDPASFSASGVHTFDAPATDRCPTLAASTTYFAVIDRVQVTSDVISLEVTTSSNEDSGGAAGWSIGDDRHFFSNGSWFTSYTQTVQAHLVVVNGVARVNNLATGVPTITGAARVGEELTADTSAIADDDGLGTFVHQWVRVDGMDDTNVGTDSSTYTVAEADLGKQIRVDVTFDDDADNAEGPLSSVLTGAVVAADHLVGNTGQTADAVGALSPSTTKRAQGFTTGSKVEGYALTSVGVSFHTIDSVSTAASQLTATINEVSGSDPGDVVCTLGHPGGTYVNEAVNTYDASNCPTLDARTSYFFVLDRTTVDANSLGLDRTASTSEDTGAADGWSIADSSHLFGSGSWFSAAAPLQIEIRGANANSPATGAPSIQGFLEDGEELTADTVGIADAGGLGAFSYQWLAGGTAIAGATSATYTLQTAEVGDAISLTVTFTDGEGFSESLTSAATYAAVASGATHKLLWLGTMEVGSVPGEDLFGYTGGGALVWDHGSLSVTELSVAGVEYTVGSVVNETGTSDLALSIYLSPAFPGPFTLHIGSVDTEFASQDASEGDVAGYQIYSWSNTNLGWSDGQKVTIFLQEKPGVILTPSTLTVAEGGTADYTVELSSEPTADVAVDITGGGDLTVNPNSLTFTSATWDTAKTVTVTAAQDDDGADDTQTVGHAVATGSASEYLEATLDGLPVTVEDDESLGLTVSFELGTYTVAEGDTVAVKVQLNADPEREVVVPLTTADQGGATSADYSGVPARLTFQSGDTEKSFTFTAILDTDDDDAESVKLGFGALPTGVTAGTTNEATVLITAEAQSSGGICDRSPAIQEAIMFRLGGLDSCSDATLAHIGNIETLHISRELGTLRSGDLVGLSSLKSLTIYGTNLHTIESGAFAPVNHTLTSATFTQNKLEPSDLSELTSGLKGLSLAHNNINSLGASAFSRFTKLEDLGLWGNPITSLDVDAFDGLSSLRSLALGGYNPPARSGNGRRRLDLSAGLFADNGSLRVLDLSNSRISTIPSNTFNNLNNLKRLVLKDNDLTTLTRDMFHADLGNLQSLSLGCNNLTTGSFSSDWSDNLDGLRDLYLHNNYLEAVVTGVVSSRDLPELRFLSLEHNPNLSNFSTSALRGYSHQLYILMFGNEGMVVQFVGGPPAGWPDNVYVDFHSDVRSCGNDSYIVQQPTFRVFDASARESNNGADSTMTFSVNLLYSDRETHSVDYHTQDGTATAGSDYTATSGTLTFRPGEYKKVVVVTVKDDTVPDSGETFQLVLSNPTGGAQLHGTGGRASGTILNHDQEGVEASFPASPYASRQHKGSSARPQVVVAFSEAVAAFGKYTPSVQVAGGTLDSVHAHAEDGIENAWLFVLAPDGDGDVTFELIPNAACASGGICTAGGTPLIQVPAALTIPGPEETETSEATAEVTARPNTPATGAPTASGTAQAGETLTADTSGITDEDGLTNVSYSYQWVADDTNIDGATNSAYTLTDADEGKTIKVKVSFTDDANNLETLTSAATAAVAAKPNTPATGAPTINGTAQVGETLTANTSSIADADGLTNVSYNYQWIRNDDGADTNIARETASAYTLVTADQGKTIRVEVSFTDDANNEETLTSAATVAVAPQSDNTVADEAVPVWSADMLVVEYSSVSIGAASADLFSNVGGSAGLQVKSLWSYTLGRDLRLAFTDGVPGAEDMTLQVGDLALAFPAGSSGESRFKWNDVDVDWEDGQTVSARIVQTSALAEPTPNTSATGAPTISGKAQVEETLTADTSGIADADGLTNVSYSYQWIRSDGNTNADIEDATDSTYEVSNDDLGQNIKVQVSFTDDAGNQESPTSEATVAVAAKPNSEPTDLPTISGTAQVGQKLTADTSGITDADGLTNVSYSYQWIRNDGTNDSDIGGQTGSTYTLTDEDVGKSIRVRVSFTDDAGNEEALTSAATAAVASRPNTPATGLPTISGTPQVGEKLTAETSAIADADGLDNVSYSYQWMVNDGNDDADIEDATVSTYTLVSADEGNTIKVRVSFTDDSDNQETLTSVATDQVAAKPNSPSTGLLTISGTARVGETLTAETSVIADEDGLDDVSYSYQWMVNDGNDDADIEDATVSTYTLVSADRGKTIKVRVSFTDDRDHAESLTSAATAAVLASVPTDPLSLTVTRGSQIQELDASWQAPASDGGSAITGYKVQWKEAADSWDTAADVSEATVTGTTHTITGLTGGVEYAVRVIATNDVGGGLASTEAKGTPAGGVSEQNTEPENTEPTGLPTIGGTPQVGETLTAATSGIADEDGLTGVTYSYQWVRTTGGEDEDIGTATGASYTPDNNDVDKTLKVRVSFEDDVGNDESLTSLPTAAVARSADGTVWSADMLVVKYSDISIGAATADLFSNIGGAGNLQVRSLWSYIPDQDIRLAFTEAFDDADGMSLMVGGLELAFPDGSSGNGSFKWTNAGPDWEDGQTIAVRIVPTTPVEPTPNTQATGLPTVSGTPQVGVTLTADTSAIADADGLTRVSYSYQWIANNGTANTDLQDATARTYTPRVNDVGKTIRVKVSFNDDAGTGESLTSIATAAVAATVPTTPLALTVTPGSQIQELDASWQAPSSNGGSAVTGYKVQWKEAADSWDTEADVSEATETGTTHTVTGLTGGVEYAVRVIATNDVGDGPASTEAKGTPAGGVSEQTVDPENTAPTGLPTISGTPQVDQTLMADTSPIDDEDGLTNVSYRYQWVAGGSDIDGATGSSHLLTTSELGQTIQVKVTFTDDRNNTETLTSEATVEVAAVPVPLTASFLAAPSSHDGDNSFTFELRFSEEVDLSYVTLRDHDAFSITDGEVTGASRLDRPGNLRWEIVVEPDSGADVTIVLPPTTDCGAQGAICTAGGKKLSSRVELTINGPEQQNQEQQNNLATGAPAISGTPQVDETLTASTSGIADQDRLTNVSYRYQWTAGGADISGATGSSHTLTAAEEGQTIQVRVTFTDDAGNDETLTSEATAAVAASDQTDPGDGPNLRSYIAVVVAEDTSDPDNPQTDFTITWSDVDACSTGYNAYFSNSMDVARGRDTTHLGSAVTDGSQIASSLSNVEGEGIIFDVELYCGTEDSGRLVSSVKIPHDDGPSSEESNRRLVPGTYSSEPPLLALTISPGTLTPTFHGHTLQYTISDVVSDGARLTLVATAKPGYGVVFVKDIIGGTIMCSPWSLSCQGWNYQDGDGNQVYPLTDADEPGFQVDLAAGEKISLHVIRAYGGAHLEDEFYRLTDIRVANTAATGAPSITGTAQVGETLTVDTTGIADADGLDNAAFTYQWLADDGNIQGAANSTYTLTDSDEGKTIKVKASFTDDAGNEETLTSAATAAVSARPNSPATGLPTISGTPQVNRTLTVDTSPIDDEDGLTNVSYLYQWIAGGSGIGGATGSSYTLTYSEQGQTIQVRVSFTDDADNAESLTSVATVAVAAKPNTTATGLPNISGTPQVGETLTADTSDIDDEDGLTNVSYRYQWIAGGSDIDGATSSSYLLTASEQGQAIQVKVTFTDDADNQESLTSAETLEVAAKPNTAAAGEPTISGTPQVEQTLTADTSAISDANGLNNVSYQYQWLRDDADIAGQTNSTYELVSADEGKTIKVRVTFTDDAGNAESLTSTATTPIAAQPAETPAVLLTASFANVPADHNGGNFTFQLIFSENVEAGYARIRDHAFTVTGATIDSASRIAQGSNQGWNVEVDPTGNGPVTITLPETTDCSASGAICTNDGRMLSHSPSATVAGPPAVSVSETPPSKRPREQSWSSPPPSATPQAGPSPWTTPPPTAPPRPGPTTPQPARP